MSNWKDQPSIKESMNPDHDDTLINSDQKGTDSLNTIPSHDPKDVGKRRRWMYDSGASPHCLNKGNLTKTERACLGRADITLQAATANGQIEVDQVIDFEIEKLGVKGKAYALDNGPSDCGVLSLGQCVEDCDGAVWWTKHHGFNFRTPKGRWINETVTS